MYLNHRTFLYDMSLNLYSLLLLLKKVLVGIKHK